MKPSLQRLTLLSSLLLCLSTSPSFAFGEAGKWSSGWGQGVSEYTAVINSSNDLYIACSERNSISMIFTADGKEYGSSGNAFNIVIDGKEIATPYRASSVGGNAGLKRLWDRMRSAKTLQIKTSEGTTFDLPIKGVAKALPKSTTANFVCQFEK